MVVLRESPWYQEIRREEGASLILRLLNRRVGTLSEEMKAKVQLLSVLQLEGLADALLDFTDMADFEEWMRSQSIA